MGKYLIFIIVLLIIPRIGFSQKKADFTFKISPQISKFDKVRSLSEFSNSFTFGVQYSVEFGFLLPKGLKLNVSIGHSRQKNIFKYDQQDSGFFIKSKYSVFPVILEYYFQKEDKDKVTVFCGVGFQYKKKTKEDVEPYPRGLPNIIYLDENSFHALFRTGVNYKFSKKFYLKIGGQLDLPIFKKSVNNAVLLGTNIGFGMSL